MVNITHVIFDVDGLLLDTERVYTESIGDFLAKYNHSFDYTLKRKMMGRKFVEAAQVLIDELCIPVSVEEFMKHQAAYLTMERWEGVDCLPGVVRLINHLSKFDIPMAIATGCGSNELTHKMKNHQDIFNQFTHSVCASDDPDVECGKPAPDVFLVAARRFPTPPSNMNNVLVFEDAPNGVQAALAAGMNVIWIPDPSEPPAPYPETVTANDASHVTRLDSLLNFKPEQFTLPPF